MIYRVWDTSKNAMYYPSTEHSIFYVGDNIKNLQTMVFCYFEDSTGIPLFEGDIVSVAFSEKPRYNGYTPIRFEGLVLLDKDGELVFLTNDTKCPVIRLNILDDVRSYLRVLGNRFQNPKFYDKFVKLYPRILQ